MLKQTIKYIHLKRIMRTKIMVLQSKLTLLIDNNITSSN